MNEELVTLTLPYSHFGDRKVRVFVPVHEDGEELPVIYMTDGQNLFEDDHPYQFGCWYTREAVREEMEQNGKGAIIVGIHNDGAPYDRTSDLTPGSIGSVIFPSEIPDEIRNLLHPRGELFDDFVIHTVMPAVEASFPVKQGRENTAFCGSSSGGLQSFFTALSHPDVISAAGVFSPVFLMYPPEEMISWVHSKLQQKMPFLHLYVGGADDLEKELLKGVKWMDGILRKCYPAELLKTVIEQDKPHHESAWMPVFKDFLHMFITQNR